MGFYGNITNTSNTTFSFDRIYPNRLAMDANANNDGIFIGRYVLVEYDNKATISNIFIDTTNVVKTQQENGVNVNYYYGYTTETFNDINTRIQYKPNNRGENKNLNVYFLGEFGQVQKTEGNQLQQEYYTEFYQCVDSIVSEQDSTISYALFKYVTKSNTTDSEYIKNFAIDEAQYKEKKGYDSTVWTKVSVKKPSGLLVTEYVRIADLNSVVPTFDLETDAPTMKPLVPHFDADSTNVYYKLHTQPQWGLRVAEVESGKISDSTTNWISSTYNPATGQLIPSEDNGEHDAAIYFNKAAFLPQVDTNRKTTDGIYKKKEDSQEQNYFTINPTGTSGNQYYLHTALDQNGNLQKAYGEAVDIQEMRINLPAIGNMMSDAWDIIYGPKRDKARTDEDGSLQGRLDSFKAIKDNHIPIKRNDDGTIIGTAINGNNNYQMPDGKNILTTTHFPLTTNDPWIDVTIDNSSLKGGYDKDNRVEISQEDNNAIRIRHSANTVDSTTTSWDKNNEEYENNSYDYYDIDTNINGEQDKIKLYTPYVDATGHVVGKNIETITLPYGYKTFTTEGLAPLDNEDKEIIEDLYTTISNQADGNNTSSSSAFTSISVANNTQDSIAIEPYNKWIQTQLSNDKLVIAHEVHAINTEKDTTDLNDLQDNQIQNIINIPDWDYDEAGHIKKKGEHTYTLPYGYKIIKVENSDSVLGAPFHTGEGKETATNTQDNLKFTASNRWIKMMPTGENNIEFGHILSPIAPEDEKIKLNSILHKSTDTNISEFGGSFNILNFTTDNAGHIIAVGQDIITIPQGKYEKDTPNSESSSLIVGMKLDGPTGEIITTSATTNTLRLADYSLPTSVDNNGVLASNQSINEAFGRLEYRINEEINKREAAFDLLYYGEEGKEGKTISKAFDTIKEIADFLEQDANGKQSGVEKILSDIEANSDNIAQEKLRAESAENANTTLINQEISRASEEEGKLNTRINDLVGDTKVSVQIDNKINTFNSTLGSAAYTESDMYALAGSYDNRVLQSVYDTKIAELEATILALTARVEALEPESETPVEGE